jgi:hypothetical protein
MVGGGANAIRTNLWKSTVLIEKVTIIGAPRVSNRVLKTTIRIMARMEPTLPSLGV